MDFRHEERYRERKKLESIVDRLDRDLDAIIVEGIGDKKVMKMLGFTGKVFLSAERKLEMLAEDVERGAERVGVMTDFDEHGKQQSKKISQVLQDRVDVISSSRREFGRQLTSNGRRTIEEIKPLFRSKRQKFVDAAMDTLFFQE
ncbi:MAG: hypothetical protein ABEJ56_00995 [Candidatus Nanohaloarchaea archaeon]